MTAQLAEQGSEIEELKATVEGGKLDQKKLAAGKTEIEQLSQCIERYTASYGYGSGIEMDLFLLFFSLMQ